MNWRILNDKETQVVVAVLNEIRRCLETRYWNKNQKEMLSPFGNHAEEYHCSAFAVHSYDWVSERNERNFVYIDKDHPERSLIAEWYKYLGRGDEVKVPEEWKMEYLPDMLKRCCDAIYEDFGERYEL